MKDSKICFAALVVVYNVKCEESATCRSLLACENDAVSVFVFDNSTSDFGNRDYCEKMGWHYLGGDGNKGLPRAYNACIFKIKEEMKEGFVCLFDDDTDFDADYFSALSKSIESNPESDLFLPLIFCSGDLISPCRLTKSYRQILFSDSDEALSYNGADLSAINSCMAVRLSVYDDYSYDEAIFLDGVDHHFMMTQLLEKRSKASVFSHVCHHSFSGMERPDRDAALSRFRMFAKDHAYWFRKKPILYWRVVGKRALHLFLTYRSFVFIRDFFLLRNHFKTK